MPFQSTVNTMPGVAVAGDFAGHNPRAVALAGPGAYVAGAAGVTIGAFAWENYQGIDPDNSPAIVNSFGSGQVTGFVHNEFQGLNTVFLSESGRTIQKGGPVTLYAAGDFWVLNSGTTAAQINQVCYANFANGLASFAASGSPTTVSGWTGGIAAGSASFTGVLSGNVLTASAVTGSIYPGAVLTGGASGTTIVVQLSGTANGAGTYAVSIGEQSVASTSMSLTYGTLTATAPSSGTLGVGQQITTGAATGTTITALGTGSGGAGTYIVNLTQTVSGGTTMVAASSVATKWVSQSAGAVGELIKISSWLQG